MSVGNRVPLYGTGEGLVAGNFAGRRGGGTIDAVRKQRIIDAVKRKEEGFI